MTEDGRIPLLVDLGDRGPFGLRLFEEVLRDLGSPVAWSNEESSSPGGRSVPALHLPHLGQVHADLDLSATMALLRTQDPVQAALGLRRRLSEAGLTALVDWSQGRMEGPVSGRLSWEDPWWVSEILGGDPSRVDPEGRLGRGVTVALADHPVDISHPALAGRCLAPLEAWRLPWYDEQAVVPDDHGTGNAGLVVGWPRVPQCCRCTSGPARSSARGRTGCGFSAGLWRESGRRRQQMRLQMHGFGVSRFP